MRSFYEHQNYTGRIPRTRFEAFGYECTITSDEKPKRSFSEKLMLYVGIVYILFAIIVVINSFLKG